MSTQLVRHLPTGFIKTCVLRYTWTGSFSQTVQLPNQGTPPFQFAELGGLSWQNSAGTVSAWVQNVTGLALNCPELMGDVMSYSNGNPTNVIPGVSQSNFTGFYIVYPEHPYLISQERKRMQGTIHLTIVDASGNAIVQSPISTDIFTAIINLYIYE